MAKLGSEKRPICVRVQSEELGQYVTRVCSEHGWHYIIGFDQYAPEDLSDLEKAMDPPRPARSEKISRNAPCPCGSGKKAKKCCAPDNNMHVPAQWARTPAA